MRKRILALALTVTVMLTSAAQDSLTTKESLPRSTDPSYVKTSFPLAVGSMLFANGFIHGMGRLTGFECSEVTMHSLRRNFRSGFEWDNDRFFMNQLGHPYQGGLSFNAARNNGFNFLQSAAFTVAGSFIWEYCGEKEPPSINDMITTSVAGTLFGECSHRLADRILDNSDRGGRRMLREATAAFLNPLQGLERLLTGKMWKVKIDEDQNENENQDENSVQRFSRRNKDEMEDAWVSISLADRYVVAADGASHGRHHPFLSVSAEYGETADSKSHFSPYDFIAVDGALAFGGKQPIIPRLNVTARICSTPLKTKTTKKTLGKVTPPSKRQGEAELGLYQFYCYDDTRIGDSLRGPFPFGETASFGPGLIMKSTSPRLTFEQRLFARGIILGTVESDYYNCYERQYNFGSGYGASSLSRLTWKDVLALQLDAYYQHLYTWRGYEPRAIAEVASNNYPNVLGDRSNARVLKLDMQLHARLTPHCGLALGTAWVTRHTHYDYHPNRHASSYELCAGLLWSL